MNNDKIQPLIDNLVQLLDELPRKDIFANPGAYTTDFETERPIDLLERYKNAPKIPTDIPSQEKINQFMNDNNTKVVLSIAKVISQQERKVSITVPSYFFGIESKSCVNRDGYSNGYVVYQATYDGQILKDFYILNTRNGNPNPAEEKGDSQLEKNMKTIFEVGEGAHTVNKQVREKKKLKDSTTRNEASTALVFATRLSTPGIKKQDTDNINKEAELSSKMDNYFFTVNFPTNGLMRGMGSFLSQIFVGPEISRQQLRNNRTRKKLLNYFNTPQSSQSKEAQRIKDLIICDGLLNINFPDPNYTNIKKAAILSLILQHPEIRNLDDFNHNVACNSGKDRTGLLQIIIETASEHNILGKWLETNGTFEDLLSSFDADEVKQTFVRKFLEGSQQYLAGNNMMGLSIGIKEFKSNCPKNYQKAINKELKSRGKDPKKFFETMKGFANLYNQAKKKESTLKRLMKYLEYLKFIPALPFILVTFTAMCLFEIIKRPAGYDMSQNTYLQRAQNICDRVIGLGGPGLPLKNIVIASIMLPLKVILTTAALPLSLSLNIARGKSNKKGKGYVKVSNQVELREPITPTQSEQSSALTHLARYFRQFKNSPNSQERYGQNKSEDLRP